ncbi:hypothetical protein CpB0422 [Chlamydia pneumoniae TW-183]|uniref:Uncharacterized protein n=2 Tax=Chlamydia pneumoniae TaxID=83558 RepID=A0ABM5LCI7_CHLPN|nr:hypothetical protein CP_0347 [Chlamydia pneumoniae AR39]AAP98353.1 hypothetical protein CpB0422 [Chlamydia pneumoniae TW-183]
MIWVIHRLLYTLLGCARSTEPKLLSFIDKTTAVCRWMQRIFSSCLRNSLAALNKTMVMLWKSY